MTIVALNDDAFSKAHDTAERGADFLFVGNQISFSDSLIAATRHELGPLRAAALHQFRDVHRLLRDAPSAPFVIVLDEPTMLGLSADERNLLRSMHGLSLGLAYANPEYAIACYRDDQMRTQVTSIFPLDVRLDIWLSIVKLIAHGGSYVCPQVASGGVTSAPSLQECGLTQRQMDVLQLVADGQSNKRIADRLGLSIHTVKLHLHNANLRLGARNRTEAAMRYRAMRS